MKKLFSLYGQILWPWLCVVVYLWAVELQAVFSLADHEPLTDRLADCSAILYTLIFWTMIACAALVLPGLLLGRSVIIRINTLVGKAILVFITAVYFIRWLVKWVIFYASYDVILWLLAGTVSVLGFVALRWRKETRNFTDSNFPSLRECFYFAVVPVLLGSMVILGVKIVGRVTSKATLFASVSTSSSSKDQVRKPNIILIVSDALRAQSMSLYGYEKETTPFLEKLGQRSDVYLNMHSNSTTTQPSVTTLLSGKDPISHGRLTRELPPPPGEDNIIRLLRESGYVTAALTSNIGASLNLLGLAQFLSVSEYPQFDLLTLSWLRDFGIHPTSVGSRMYQDLAGVLRFIGFPSRTSNYGSADDTFALARRVVDQLREPFFLFIHVNEPHDPYYAPLPFRHISAAEKALSWRGPVPTEVYSHYPPEFQKVADVLKERYEESIRFLDLELMEFVRFLDAKPWAENALLVFTGDHGESFERGYLNHGEDLYESSTRVPLVIRFPGQRRGAMISGLVQSTDIAPTILRAAGISIPAWMDGRSLIDGMTPETVETIAVNFKHPTGETFFPFPTKLAIWREHYKMIISCDDSKVELYDLSEDPQEISDISARAVDVVRTLKQRLKLYLARQPRGRHFLCAVQ